MPERIPVQLVQLTPSTANVTTALTKSSKDKLLLTSINVVNTDSSSRTFSIYVDEDGTTANVLTAIASNETLAANSRVLLEWAHGLPMDKHTANGTISVQASAANVVTFTVAGIMF